jgi:hypothetical protein
MGLRNGNIRFETYERQTDILICVFVWCLCYERYCTVRKLDLTRNIDVRLKEWLN